MAEPNATVIERLAALPRAPGVYCFRDAKGQVIYVGKAVNLHARVRSYFGRADDGRALTEFLVRAIAEIETIVTATEQEALVLENNLIKKFKPTYNIRLRDDKSFIFVGLDLSHAWPRATIVRRPKKDGRRYFGPFASATAIRETLKALEPVFPLRLCSDRVLANRSRACLYHDIGRCAAPCVGLVQPEEYRALVSGFCDFFRGRDASVIEAFEARMQRAASERQYEIAAVHRDRLAALRQVVEAQHAECMDFADRDVFGIVRAGATLQIAVLFYRHGKLLAHTSHRYRSVMPDAVVLEQFLAQFYQGEQEIPRELVVPLPLDQPGMLEAWLAARAGHAVDVRFAKRGELLRLVELAQANARHAHEHRAASTAHEEAVLRALQTSLELERFPAEIECYDISTIQGTFTVGSQVTFRAGRPDKSRYKRYKVASENAGDDFAAMREVLTRRLRRAREGDPLPDLIVLDGGIGQLGQVLPLLSEAGVIGTDVVALAKYRTRTRRGRRVTKPERVYKLPGQPPLILPADSAELYLLQRIRDEAHRFAIAYHRTLRQKSALTSGLDAIPGVGVKRRHALLSHFGSSRAVREATAEQLAEVQSIPPALAEAIFAHFHEAGAAPSGSASGSASGAPPAASEASPVPKAERNPEAHATPDARDAASPAEAP